jgi:protein TonB
MMMGPGPEQTSNTKRVFAFFIVVAVHVILIYGINAGLTDVILDKVLGNLQTVEIAAPKEEEDKPPPPPPKMEVPPPFVPPPEISIEIAPTETTTAIQVVTQTRPVEAAPVVAARKSMTVPPKTPKTGLTQPEYPASEKRAEHTGTVMLSIMVLENGRVGEVKVQTSSGFPRLDEAALAEAKRWRFVPGTEDGKPAAMLVSVPIVFKLTNN